MKKALKYCRILFTVYLALYFVCNAAFHHNHIIDGHSISHSHPFKGVQHSAAGAEIIQLFNSTAALVTEAAAAPECILMLMETIGESMLQHPASATQDAIYLRGPPAFQVL